MHAQTSYTSFSISPLFAQHTHTLAFIPQFAVKLWFGSASFGNLLDLNLNMCACFPIIFIYFIHSSSTNTTIEIHCFAIRPVNGSEGGVYSFHFSFKL